MERANARSTDGHTKMCVDPEVVENPKSPSSSGCRERNDASRFRALRGAEAGKKEGELGGLVVRVPDQDVRHSSTSALTGIEMEPYSMSALLPRAKKPGTGSSR